MIKFIFCNFYSKVLGLPPVIKFLKRLGMLFFEISAAHETYQLWMWMDEAMPVDWTIQHGNDRELIKQTTRKGQQVVSMAAGIWGALEKTKQFW